ncbi:MAG TPA: alpha/beta hydrolase [Pseudoduganella sp.]
MEIDAIASLIRQATARLPSAATVEQMRACSNALHDSLPLPEGVQFAEVSDPPGLWSRPPVCERNAVILYLHGGGYVLNSPMQYRMLTGQLCLETAVDVFALAYRRAPEAPFPAALEDALAAYQWLRRTRPGAEIAIAGDSAGGGLALALMLRCRKHGAAEPRSAFLMSPWADMTMSGASLHGKAGVDPVVTPAALAFYASQYLHGANPRDPYVSPVFADLRGLAPLLIHVGSEEVLLDDSLRLAAAAGTAKVEVTLKVWPHMIHKWHIWHSRLPAAAAALKAAGGFIREHW